ncbi:MAG: hypothetical protein FWH27_18830 [Planctomycetaceae bacterium]|nr:hypothetical protein [Planctomycetaceae bacterium]
MVAMTSTFTVRCLADCRKSGRIKAMNPEPAPQFPFVTAYALAVANALIIGLSFSLVKVAVTLAGPVDTLAFRFVIALAVCFLFARLKGERGERS